MATFAFAYSPPDCPRKRKRQTWTDEENRIILSSVRRLGTQWDLVAAQLPGRTADAVRNQCHRLQKSSGAFGVMDDDCVSDVSSEDRKIGSAHGRTVWTAEEDRVICEGVRSLGCKWRKIAALLPGRSDSSVRNRWSRIGESADNQKAPCGEQPLPLPQEVPSERDALDMRAVPAHSAGMLPEHAYHVPVFTATVLYPHGRARQPKHKYELAPTEDLPSELRHAGLCPAPADLRGDLPQHEFDDLSYSDSPGPSSHAPPVEPLMTLFVSLEHDDEAYSAATASPSA